MQTVKIKINEHWQYGQAEYKPGDIAEIPANDFIMCVKQGIQIEEVKEKKEKKEDAK